MKFRRSLTNLLIGAGVLFATAATAFAAPAVATGSVNVRSGPSTGYARVDTLQRNQLVEVTGCRNGWCYIEKRGPDGWVSARYLQEVRARATKPSVSFSINFGTTPTVRPPRHHDNDWRRDRDRDRDRDRWDDRGGNHRGNYGNNNSSGFSFQFGN